MTDTQEQTDGHTKGLYAVEFISSHKGGQHTNGPDYGVVRVTDGDGNAVEVQTRPRLHAHQAKELAISVLELLA